MRSLLNHLPFFLLLLLTSCGGDTPEKTTTETGDSPITSTEKKEDAGAATVLMEAVYEAVEKKGDEFAYLFKNDKGEIVSLSPGRSPAAESLVMPVAMLGDSPLGYGERANPLLVGVKFVLEMNDDQQVVRIMPKDTLTRVTAKYDGVTMYAGSTDYLFSAPNGAPFFVTTDNFEEGGFQFPDDFTTFGENEESVPNSEYTAGTITLLVNQDLQVVDYVAVKKKE